MKRDDLWVCDFCGKDSTQTKGLFVTANESDAAMCQQCLADATRMMTAEHRKREAAKNDGAR